MAKALLSIIHVSFLALVGLGVGVFLGLALAEFVQAFL
jgi:hypothetical protein